MRVTGLLVARFACLFWLADPVSAQVLSGTTFDGRSGERIAAVRVEVLAGDSTLAAGLTDAEGRFSLVIPDLPRYRLRLSAFGYADLELDVLGGASALGPVDIRLSPEAVELEGVTATVQATARPADWTGFARRDSIGRGEFYLKSEFQKHPAFTTPQLLRQLPLIRATPAGIRIGGRCRPDIFVDGSLTPGGLPRFPEFIIAVEVYQASAIIPPRWRRPSRDQCGAIVVWTTVASGGG